MKRNLISSGAYIVIYERGFYRLVFLSAFFKETAKRKKEKKEARAKAIGG